MSILFRNFNFLDLGHKSYDQVRPSYYIIIKKDKYICDSRFVNKDWWQVQGNPSCQFHLSAHGPIGRDLT